MPIPILSLRAQLERLNDEFDLELAADDKLRVLHREHEGIVLATIDLASADPPIEQLASFGGGLLAPEVTDHWIETGCEFRSADSDPPAALRGPALLIEADGDVDVYCDA